MTAVKYQLIAAANPTVTRIIPELAVEIGLNESIVLLQIAFWIETSNTEPIDGDYWTFQSLRDMKRKAFDYWGVETIRRAADKLVRLGLLKTGNHNKRKGDNTTWYALNIEGISTLKSIGLRIVEAATPKIVPKKPVSKRDTLSQSETPKSQNETTLPESTTEIPTESIAPNGAKPEVTFDDLPGYMETRAIHGPVINARQALEDAIYAALGWEKDKVTAGEKGKVDAAVRDLYNVGRRAEHIPIIYDYCVKHLTTFGPNALATNASTALSVARPKTIPLNTNPTSQPLTDAERAASLKASQEARAKLKEGAS